MLNKNQKIKKDNVITNFLKYMLLKIKFNGNIFIVDDHCLSTISSVNLSN